MTAHNHDHATPSAESTAPAEFWEGRYSGAERVWSGRVNPVLAELAATLAPGRALDLGCGEGGDVVWLAEQGWHATGIDISPTAVARAGAAAEARGLGERTDFLVADLTELREQAHGDFDLVTASFLQSPVALDRQRILRQAAGLVAPGGHLLITAHAHAPHAAADDERGELTPEGELADLALAPGDWATERAERRPRAPREDRPMPDDIVVLIRRR